MQDITIPITGESATDLKKKKKGHDCVFEIKGKVVSNDGKNLVVKPSDVAISEAYTEEPAGESAPAEESTAVAAMKMGPKM